MENMFIIYSVVIITLFISNSKGCGSGQKPSTYRLRSDKIGEKLHVLPDQEVKKRLRSIFRADFAFEVCDMDRNGLTWKEVSSCIVRFTYVHIPMSDSPDSFKFHPDVINIRMKFGLKLFFASIQIRLGIEWSHKIFDRESWSDFSFLWPYLSLFFISSWKLLISVGI